MAALIYLASPYSHTSPAVREHRYELTRIATARLLEEGFPVFSPIVYGKSMEKIVGTDYLSWKPLNDAMLESSGFMLVLKLDGWLDSKGIKYEIDKAKRLEIPVSYIMAPEISR